MRAYKRRLIAAKAQRIAFLAECERLDAEQDDLRAYYRATEAAKVTVSNGDYLPMHSDTDWCAEPYVPAVKVVQPIRGSNASHVQRDTLYGWERMRERQSTATIATARY